MNIRPFEDLIKPIEYDGETFVPIEEIAKLADWHIELSNPVITAEIIHKYNTSACKANIKQYIKDCIKEYSKSRNQILVNIRIKFEQLNLLFLRVNFFFINIFRRFIKSQNKVYLNIKNIEEATIVIIKFESKIIEHIHKYEKKKLG